MKYTTVILAFAASVMAMPAAMPETATLNSRVGLSDICYGCKRSALAEIEDIVARNAVKRSAAAATENKRVGLSDICYGCKREAVEAIEDIIAREAKPVPVTENKRVGLDDRCYSGC